MGVTVLSDTAQPGKFGVVYVTAKDGSFDRSFRITAAEYNALALPNAGAPPGVTAQEWESGLAYAWRSDFEVGDARLREDGSIRMKLAESQNGSAFMETYVTLSPGSYTGVYPAISVSPLSLSAQNLSKSVGLVAIDAIVAGTVTWR